MYRSIYLGATLCVLSGLACAQSNQADIQQNGTGNAHTVQQTGTNESLILIQGTTADPSTQNQAEVTMAGSANEVFIRQVGGPNSQTNVQVGSTASQVDVAQQGADHQTTVRLGLNNGTVLNSAVSVEQTGRQHTATVEHAGEIGMQSTDNGVSIEQTGEQHVATVIQQAQTSSADNQTAIVHKAEITTKQL